MLLCAKMSCCLITSVTGRVGYIHVLRRLVDIHYEKIGGSSHFATQVRLIAVSP